mmetsp:Transcript_46534/g.47240  ORF Transcript_46534/g.47240 Transcript_46534/m.47240 type:complete len:110 (+) Transcript_46534:55-384(+)
MTAKDTIKMKDDRQDLEKEMQAFVDSNKARQAAGALADNRLDEVINDQRNRVLELQALRERNVPAPVLAQTVAHQIARLAIEARQAAAAAALAAANQEMDDFNAAFGNP